MSDTKEVMNINGWYKMVCDANVFQLMYFKHGKKVITIDKQFHNTEVPFVGKYMVDGDNWKEYDTSSYDLLQTLWITKFDKAAIYYKNSFY